MTLYVLFGFDHEPPLGIFTSKKKAEEALASLLQGQCSGFEFIIEWPADILRTELEVSRELFIHLKHAAESEEQSPAA